MALGLMRPQVMTTDDLLTLRNVLGLRRRALLDRLATDTGESLNRPTSACWPTPTPPSRRSMLNWSRWKEVRDETGRSNVRLEPELQ